MTHIFPFSFLQNIEVCFACHDNTGLVTETFEVEAEVQCEESYWKRFKGKRSYYHDKHPYAKDEKMEEDEGEDEEDEVEELAIEGNERQARYAHYLHKMCDKKFKDLGLGPKLTIDKCQSSCKVKSNVPRQ